jgi:predicted transcriptional regulator
VRRNPGELELTVLRILWSHGAALSARDVVSQFPEQHATPALTTVLTVLDRLAKKGSVTRSESGPRGAVFRASTPESAFTADAMVSALAVSSDRNAALLRFAGELDSRDIEVLRRAIVAAE